MPEPLTMGLLATSLFYGGFLIGKYTEGNLKDGVVFTGTKSAEFLKTRIAFSWKLMITLPVKSERISTYHIKQDI